jgi:Protein of unknown function (DUF3800)
VDRDGCTHCCRCDDLGVLLAYADESGDPGPIDAGGSLTYTVGCVLLDAEAWPEAFDGLLAFRRRLRDTFGLPMRAEVKASHLIQGGGAFRPLGLAPAQRGLIYRAHLRSVAQLGAVRAFAVVLDKRSISATGAALAEMGWTTLLERLERTSHYENQPFMLVHDEGDNSLVRRVTRKARRRITAGSAYGTGQVVRAAVRLIDDPVPRRSDHSYFIQLSDLVAYAAFRTVVPPGHSVAAVAPAATWLELGNAIHHKVNSISGGIPGIVVRK